MSRFAGKTAIITGGDAALGQAVTTRLLSEGAAVCVWDIAVTQEHEDKDVLRIAVDVANPDSVVAAFERTLRWRNTIDILVSSAGITGPTRLCWEYSSEDWVKLGTSKTFMCWTGRPSHRIHIKIPR